MSIIIVCLALLFILFLSKYIFDKNAENAISYCKYRIWKAGENNTINKNLYSKRLSQIKDEIIDYSVYHNGRIKRLFSMRKHWKEYEKSNKKNFFVKFISYLYKEVVDNFRKQNKRIKVFSNLWYRIPKKERKIFQQKGVIKK